MKKGIGRGWTKAVWLVGIFGLLGLGCQDYELAFQPRADRLAARLQFAVQQPSKADILFVIDNSGSMGEEQDALLRSIGRMLEELAPQDTRYRIGMVSTDAIGDDFDCCGRSLAVSGAVRGGKGDCRLEQCSCSLEDGPSACAVRLRRPHDGAMGRLVAAYSEEAFDAAAYGLSADNEIVLASLLPTGLVSGAEGINGDQGARWVIDRELIRAEACLACDACAASECGGNDTQTECFSACVEPVAGAMVQAYFRANLAGLGVNGVGWEEGIKAALWAVGVDPEQSQDELALAPGYDLTRAGEPNRLIAYTDAVDEDGAPVLGDQSWLRPDALLAVMFVSDEEDCTMPADLKALRVSLDEAVPGSLCYRDATFGELESVRRMRDLLVAKKGGVESRVAVGFIGGLDRGSDRRTAEAKDCIASSSELPDTACACLSGRPEELWCELTQNSDQNLAACNAMAGNRYSDFAQQFSRRTFESICRNDDTSFGDAMADFARIATLACFDLDDESRPAGGAEGFIEVRRRGKDQVGDLEILPRRSPDAREPGWYYEAIENQICLTGLDRLIGDEYEVFVQKTNDLDFSR